MCSEFNPSKTQLVFNVLWRGQQDLLTLIFTIVHITESQGMSKLDRILLRIDAGESDIELSGDELEGQTVEQQGESSEEDVSTVEKPSQKKNERTLWMRSNV